MTDVCTVIVNLQILRVINNQDKRVDVSKTEYPFIFLKEYFRGFRLAIPDLSFLKQLKVLL